jgi:hypothetical protein
MGTTLTYNAYLQPWQATTSMPRLEPGVVRMATISGGVPGPFTTVLRGAAGDARAASVNSLTSEFLGDYNDIKASASGAVAVWRDPAQRRRLPGRGCLPAIAGQRLSGRGAGPAGQLPGHVRQQRHLSAGTSNPATVPGRGPREPRARGRVPVHRGGRRGAGGSVQSSAK